LLFSQDPTRHDPETTLRNRRVRVRAADLGQNLVDDHVTRSQAPDRTRDQRSSRETGDLLGYRVRG